MIIIGEKLNTSIETVREAVQNKDAATIKNIALSQIKAGADYIDVNCGTFVENEPELLKWMVSIVEESTDKPLCIDSPNPQALEAALNIHKNKKPIINSITAQRDRYERILPLIIEHKTSVIALCMDDQGIPHGIEDRISIAEKLVNSLVKEGVPYDNIFIDPMIQPVATQGDNGLNALKTISSIKDMLPNINIVCGLSNISYGLPQRNLINKTFLILAMYAGLNAAILDPMAQDIIPQIYTTNLLLGKDEYCLEYIEYIRTMEV